MIRSLFFLILILSSNIYASELEDAQELVGLLKTNSKLHNLKFNNIIVVQGNEKKLSSPVYTIINNKIVDIIAASKQHNVKYIERQPYLNIIGTPTSLKISNDSKKKIRDIAVAHNADSVFFWNLISYDKNLYFTARVVDVQSNKTLWTYQKDLKKLHAEQKEMMQYKGPLRIPLESFIILTGDVEYIRDGYKRDAVLPENNINTQIMMSMSAEYLTSTIWNPKFSFGVISGVSTTVASSLNVTSSQLLVDFRYQLNDYIAPLYDTSTGVVLENRNKQKYSIGASVGSSYISVRTARSNNIAITARAYLNAMFTENLEFNIGLSYIDKQKYILDSNPNYTQNKVNIGGVNLFMSVGYKFKLNKDK